ncbi:MAG: hypothetical protein V7K48_19015 [Nostoc sp.]|uniref:hypothetical protein n=1 Tax=Nostoc sp. TaxID=1180 RepID=UPI002FFBC756
MLQTWLTEIEYAILEIPKYWIVGPIQKIVTFQRLERIISSTFPQLDLSAEQVLAGRK